MCIGSIKRVFNIVLALMIMIMGATQLVESSEVINAKVEKVNSKTIVIKPGRAYGIRYNDQYQIITDKEHDVIGLAKVIGTTENMAELEFSSQYPDLKLIPGDTLNLKWVPLNQRQSWGYKRMFFGVDLGTGTFTGDEGEISRNDPWTYKTSMDMVVDGKIGFSLSKRLDIYGVFTMTDFVNEGYEQKENPDIPYADDTVLVENKKQRYAASLMARVNFLTEGNLQPFAAIGVWVPFNEWSGSGYKTTVGSRASLGVNLKISRILSFYAQAESLIPIGEDLGTRYHFAIGSELTIVSF